MKCKSLVRLLFAGLLFSSFILLQAPPSSASPSGWVRLSQALDNAFYGVDFVNANVGTVVGGGGVILRTTDGGATWTPQASNTTVALRAVEFLDANTGVAVGDQGTILCTNDGGATWVSKASGTGRALFSVSLLSGTKWLALGYMGSESSSIDGGQTWAFSDWSEKSMGCCFIGASFCSETVGIGVGAWLMTLRTTDGGVTWNFRSYDNPYDVLHDVACFDADIAVAVGSYANPEAAIPEKGAIYRTTNGGATWNVVGWTGPTMHAVSFGSPTSGTAVGAGGAIFRTTNGGLNWTPQTSGTVIGLNDVCFTDANTGMAVGDGGLILRTTDGGATWTRNGVVAVLIQSYAAAWERDHVRVTWSLAAGALDSEPSFEVYRSGDGGKSYVALMAPDVRLEGQEYVLRDYAAEPGASYRYRIVARETDGDSASFEVEVATPALTFSLAQNRPNPFNPTTSIDFTLAGAGSATLGIYDVAGRLVRTIAPGKLPAGAHTIRWDGRDARGKALPSGVYFYRLDAGKQSAAKKMILLR